MTFPLPSLLSCPGANTPGTVLFLCVTSSPVAARLACLLKSSGNEKEKGPDLFFGGALDKTSFRCYNVIAGERINLSRNTPYRPRAVQVEASRSCILPQDPGICQDAGVLLSSKSSTTRRAIFSASSSRSTSFCVLSLRSRSAKA